MFKLVEALHARGLRTPVLLRFLDIVADRIERLNVSRSGRRVFMEPPDQPFGQTSGHTSG